MAPDRRRSLPHGRAPAWTLLELLLTTGLVMLLATWVSRGAAEARARQGLQAASQRVVAGLEEARAAAVREGRPCGLRLGPTGWERPQGSTLSPCGGVAAGLGTDAPVEVSHNLPDPVRFSVNGLVLDGGTVWLRSLGTSLARCVVVSLPLGVTRVGQEGSSGCEPERTL